MSTKSFSKGLVEIIGSSENSERVESEILQVFNAIADHKEALDVFTDSTKVNEEVEISINK